MNRFLMAFHLGGIYCNVLLSCYQTFPSEQALGNSGKEQSVNYHTGSIRDGSAGWCLNLLVGDVITVVLTELSPQLVHTSMWHILASFGLCLQTLRSWIWWRTTWEFCNSYQVSLPKSERTGAEWQHTGICSILCVFWWTRQPGEAQVNLSFDTVQIADLQKQPVSCLCVFIDICCC